MSNLVFHHSSRTYRPVFWEKFYKKNGVCQVPEPLRLERKQLETLGNARMASLLQGDVVYPQDPYGIGTERTLSQFQEWSGIDFMSKSCTSYAKLGLTQHADDEERYTKYGFQAFS